MHDISKRGREDKIRAGPLRIKNGGTVSEGQSTNKETRSECNTEDRFAIQACAVRPRQSRLPGAETTGINIGKLGFES